MRVSFAGDPVCPGLWEHPHSATHTTATGPASLFTYLFCLKVPATQSWYAFRFYSQGWCEPEGPFRGVSPALSEGQPPFLPSGSRCESLYVLLA